MNVQDLKTLPKLDTTQAFPVEAVKHGLQPYSYFITHYRPNAEKPYGVTWVTDLGRDVLGQDEDVTWFVTSADCNAHLRSKHNAVMLMLGR